jgi:hypothetical protein
MVLASASFGSSALAQTDVSGSPEELDLVDNTAFFGDGFLARRRKARRD